MIRGMNTDNDITLEAALRAARELPEEEQRQIAQVLMTLVENQHKSRLAPEQREILRQRLRKPRVIADEGEVEALLRHFESAP